METVVKSIFLVIKTNFTKEPLILMQALMDLVHHIFL